MQVKATIHQKVMLKALETIWRLEVWLAIWCCRTIARIAEPKHRL